MPVKTQKNPQERDKPQQKEREEHMDEDQTEDSEAGEKENEQEQEPAAKPAKPQKNGAKDSPVHADRESLLIGLNHDLAGEYQAILMYTHYAAKLTGPYRKELRALFQGEVVDEQGHAQFLADKIAVLGGEPTTQPRPVISADNPRAMLENALAAEKQAIADYQIRIEQAEAFGDVGLKVDLENQIADETRHKEELERILAGWQK
jgi:bacterioferritin